MNPDDKYNNSSVPNALTNGLKFIPISITANDPPPAIMPNNLFACCGLKDSAAKAQN